MSYSKNCWTISKTIFIDLLCNKFEMQKMMVAISKVQEILVTRDLMYIPDFTFIDHH